MLEKTSSHKEVKACQMASVVVPARDGTLEALGYDVAKLGSQCLGFVIEARSNKSLVFFPGLKLSLWLPHTELADVFLKANSGDANFKKFIAESSSDAALNAQKNTQANRQQNIVWTLAALCKAFPLKAILGVEVAKLDSLWQENLDSLSQYYQASKNIDVLYVGLGLPELLLSDWQKVQNQFASQLLFARFLPAGMHKIEVAIYLSLDPKPAETSSTILSNT